MIFQTECNILKVTKLNQTMANFPNILPTKRFPALSGSSQWNIFRWMKQKSWTRHCEYLKREMLRLWRREAGVKTDSVERWGCLVISGTDVISLLYADIKYSPSLLLTAPRTCSSSHRAGRAVNYLISTRSRISKLEMRGKGWVVFEFWRHGLHCRYDGLTWEDLPWERDKWPGEVAVQYLHFTVVLSFKLQWTPDTTCKKICII